jgi:hypothetical protein
MGQRQGIPPVTRIGEFGYARNEDQANMVAIDSVRAPAVRDLTIRRAQPAPGHLGNPTYSICSVPDAEQEVPAPPLPSRKSFMD